MKDINKTKEQLLNELTGLRQRITALERSETEFKLTKEKLRESEEKYRSLVEKSGAGIATASTKGKFTYVNKALCKMMGYSKEELLGKPFARFLHPDDKKNILKIFRSSWKSPRKELHLEFRVIHKRGHTIYCSSKPTLFIYKKKIAGFNAVITDITDRKKAVETLQESEKHYRHLVELSPDIIAIHSEGNIDFINRTGASLLGATNPKQIIGKPIIDFLHPDYRKIVKERLREIRDEGKELSLVEEKFIRLDGTDIDAEVIAMPFTYKGRLATMAIARDITERKKAEEKVRYQVNLLENVSDAVISTDTNFNILSWNKAAEKIYGWKEDEVIGKLVNDITKLEYPYDNQDEVVKKFWEEGYWKGEVIQKHKSGKAMNIYTSVSSIKDSARNLIGAVAVNRDITERKKTEEALRASESFNFALFQYNPMEIMVVDYAGKIIKTNLARRKSGDRWPNIGDVMYKDYAAKHEIDMFAELMESIRSKKTKNFSELKYGNKYLSIIIAPFPMGAIIISQDITKLKLAERQIKASLREKEILLQEIHHRVKNNMQVIFSILNLQSRSIKSKRVLEIFKSSQDRVRSMALIHEKLYQSKDFTKVDFPRYVQSLAVYLFSSYGISSEAIRLTMDIKDISLGINTAIACGLIINELVSNSLKHAFPDRKKGEIKIVIHPLNENEIELIVSDNGIGMPKEVDIRHTKSLGLHLVTILAEDQLQGEIKLDRTKGTSFHIKLKVKK